MVDAAANLLSRRIRQGDVRSNADARCNAAHLASADRILRSTSLLLLSIDAGTWVAQCACMDSLRSDNCAKASQTLLLPPHSREFYLNSWAHRSWICGNGACFSLTVLATRWTVHAPHTELTEEQFDRNTSAFNQGLAVHHCWVHLDAVGHRLAPSLRSFRRA